MMAGFVMKMSLSVFVVCGALSSGAFVVAEALPHHLLLFRAGEAGSGVQQLYLTHLERDLVIQITERELSGPAQILISPDQRWLLDLQWIQLTECYTLINLHTWEMIPVPVQAIENIGCPFSVRWASDGSGMSMAYGGRGTEDLPVFIFDFDTHVLTEKQNDPALLRDYVYHYPLMAVHEGGYVPTGEGESFSVRMDEEGFPRLYVPEPDEQVMGFSADNPMTISPDFDYIAAAILVDGQMDLYQVPTWEGEPIRLTNNDARESVPLWSPDGRYIAYLSQNNNLMEIHVYDLEAGAVNYVVHVGGLTTIRWNEMWIE